MNQSINEELKKKAKERRYSVSEVLSSLSFSEFDADYDFDGFIHIYSDINGDEVKIEFAKIRTLQSKISEAIAVERKELMDKVEGLRKDLPPIKWKDEHEENHAKAHYNEAIDQVLSLLKDENSQLTHKKQ